VTHSLENVRNVTVMDIPRTATLQLDNAW